MGRSGNRHSGCCRPLRQRVVVPVKRDKGPLFVLLFGSLGPAQHSPTESTLHFFGVCNVWCEEKEHMVVR
jgi:hypothetical protein